MTRSTIIILTTLTFFSCNIVPSENANKVASTETPKNYFEETKVFSELSHLYDYKWSEKSYINSKGNDSICTVTITVVNKNDKKLIDEFSVQADRYYVSGIDSGLFRSTITGYNKDSIGDDLYFGQLNITDFNFDGKEDIAIVVSNAGNIGFDYRCFVQNESSKFIENEELNGLYPDPDDKKKTLTRIHAYHGDFYFDVLKIDASGKVIKISSKAEKGKPI